MTTRHGRDPHNQTPPEPSADQSLIDSFDDDDSSDAMFWLEQELLSDYDPDLRHLPHEDADASDNLPSQLRIDALVAKAADATDSQRRQIAELLNNLEPERLRHWLPRLRQKPWTGHSLLLFLQFREVWDQKDDWWESTYWDRSMQVWYPIWNRANLSIDHTYILIHNRLHYQPQEIIDHNWLEEWNSMHRWLDGYYSFASYAVYRSRFS